MNGTADMRSFQVCARPVVKWPGGKSSELQLIRPRMPRKISRLIEPFVGGGALLFSCPPALLAKVNDVSMDLVDLYKALANNDRGLLSRLEIIDVAWRNIEHIMIPRESGRDELVCRLVEKACMGLVALNPQLPVHAGQHARTALARKRTALARFALQANLEQEGDLLLKSALKSAVYSALRQTYNHGVTGLDRTAIYWFLREFCYGAMFRVNASGEFNVPYGGKSYDSRSMSARVLQWQTPAIENRLASTEFHQGDFQDFIENTGPVEEDFVFADPPYDSPFSTYDGKSFNRDDHTRLARCLGNLSCNWMLVISETPFVRETYLSLPDIHVHTFTKEYAANIKCRFERKVTHLMVANYALDG